MSVRALALLAPAALAVACTARYEVRGDPAVPFDAIVVPGCPSEDDGRLSRCQLGRALWATSLWERGHARHFIASGAAVHSPYVEAEAIAEAMAVLGVPPERILLEPDALHTDENMYYSLGIARRLGWSRMAVASNSAHAGFACQMLAEWGQPCGAYPLDERIVAERHRLAPPALAGVRARRVPDWVPLAERERRIAQRTGRRRPPSFLFYPMLAGLHAQGLVHVPPPPPPRLLRTWAEQRRVGEEVVDAR